MTAFANINYCWGHLIVEELLRQGADYFCIAPGSRSSPLAISIARHRGARTFVHFDERGLGFHALGYAAAAGKPAVLVCTSGSAVANFLPAVVEAAKKKLPLIVLTADRPPELRQTGAAQTIDQVGIFGRYTVWSVDLPCPDLAITPAYVLTTIDQAFHQAVSKGGVAHVNCMLREPLAPLRVRVDWPGYLAGIARWEQASRPYTAYVKAPLVLAPGQLAGAAERVKGINNGIVAAGKLDNDQSRAAVLALAKRLGWPVFADIASGLRLGRRDPQIIAYYDQILLDSSKIKIDGVIHAGGRMTSRRYYDFIQQQNPREYIMVLNHGLRSDPGHQVSLRYEARVEDFCRRLRPLVKARPQGALLNALSAADRALEAKFERLFAAQERLSEPGAARLVSRLIPRGAGLYLSNSMPIRDMDMYANPGGKAARVCGNRGASGIDGLIASSIGYAQGLKAPVVLMAGDLAALHDLNSLAMLKDAAYPLIAVILNNGGGGIFSFLPVAREKDVFEKLYGTPHPFTFADAAAMFELKYANPRRRDEFVKAFQAALRSSTSTVIEVTTSRQENLTLHQTLQMDSTGAVIE